MSEDVRKLVGDNVREQRAKLKISQDWRGDEASGEKDLVCL